MIILSLGQNIPSATSKNKTRWVTNYWRYQPSKPLNYCNVSKQFVFMEFHLRFDVCLLAKDQRHSTQHASIWWKHSTPWKKCDRLKKDCCPPQILQHCDQVRLNSNLSEPFPIINGVKQGSFHHFLPYKLVTAFILMTTCLISDNYRFEISNQKISLTDNAALVSHSERTLQHNILICRGLLNSMNRNTAVLCWKSSENSVSVLGCLVMLTSTRRSTTDSQRQTVFNRLDKWVRSKAILYKACQVFVNLFSLGVTR